MMSASDQELEVKFYLSQPQALVERLERTGASLARPRMYEANLRFDTADGALASSFQVLRLRLDDAARVTYKGPGSLSGGARLRRELEFTVSDFDTARALFEALGYQVVVMYEKYRMEYHLGDVLVTVDEMPYGFFTEIEGPDGETIQAAARQLGLDWKARIIDSYLMLFDHLKTTLELEFRDLSFENFKGLPVSAAQLGVISADQGG
jgi:adenylate cyclase class 2